MRWPSSWFFILALGLMGCSETSATGGEGETGGVKAWSRTRRKTCGSVARTWTVIDAVKRISASLESVRTGCGP